MAGVSSTFVAVLIKQIGTMWQAAALCAVLDIALAPTDTGAAFWGAIGGLILWISLKNSLTWWEGMLRVVAGAIVAVAFDGAGIRAVEYLYPNDNSFGVLRGSRVIFGFGGVTLVSAIADFAFAKLGIKK